MSEQRAPLTEIRYRQLLPWLILFRCIRSAYRPKNLFIATLGLVFAIIGWRLINTVFEPIYLEPGPEDPTGVLSAQVPYPWDNGGAAEQIWTSYKVSDEAQLPFDVVQNATKDPLAFLWHLGTNWELFFRPYLDVLRPFLAFANLSYGETSLRIVVRGRSILDVGQLLHVLALIAWITLVWGVAGGTIARIAGLEVGRHEMIRLRDALVFCRTYVSSYVMGLCIVVIFFLMVAAAAAVGGWLANIPYFGPLFAGTLWLLPIIAGLILSIVALLFVVGWPLSVVTISIEGTDAFDGVSRALQYPSARPWHYLFYVLLAGILASVSAFVVLLFLQLTIYFAYWAVSWGMIDEYLAALHGLMPSYLKATLPPVPANPSLEPVDSLGAVLISLWITVIALLGAAYPYSFFWCAASAIYLLMRFHVDATEMDEIWEEEEEFEDLLGTYEEGGKEKVDQEMGLEVGDAGGPLAPSGEKDDH